jgi:hypothetical protein
LHDLKHTKRLQPFSGKILLSKKLEIEFKKEACHKFDMRFSE